MSSERKTTFDFTAGRPYIKAAAERTRAEIDRLNNPHTFAPVADYGSEGSVWIVVDTDGFKVNDEYYSSFDDASDAIGAMIADDDADRRLNRNRHEGSE